MTRLFAGTPFDIPPTCEDCGELETACTCTREEKAASEQRRQREAAMLPPEQQTARLSLQKRKGGRQATVVEGLTGEANDLNDLLSQLQGVCGSGGTVKANDDLIELQGNHLGVVRDKLTSIGYRVK